MRVIIYIYIYNIIPPRPAHVLPAQPYPAAGGHAAAKLGSRAPALPPHPAAAAAGSTYDTGIGGVSARGVSVCGNK